MPLEAKGAPLSLRIALGSPPSRKRRWLGLIDVSGLQLDALYAGFAGEPFTDDSREYVFVARR